MTDIGDNFDNLNTALDSNFEHKPITKKIDSIPAAQNTEEKIELDYSLVRKNLYELIDDGKDAIRHILSVAKAGDSPRAYEVVSQMLKTVAEMNKDVLEVHDKVKKIKEDKFNLTQKNTTNNTFYVGSTSELQDLISPERSSGKNIKKV